MQPLVFGPVRGNGETKITSSEQVVLFFFFFSPAYESLGPATVFCNYYNTANVLLPMRCKPDTDLTQEAIHRPP